MSEMKEGGKKIPAFFKVFIPENCSQRLQIPLAFGLHVKGMLPEMAYLRDINEKIWPVEVAKSGDDLFFQDGWVEFVEENGVEEGDFLVFQFNGNYFFDFKLLGKTACEKRYREAFDFKEKEEVVEEAAQIRHEEVERRDEEGYVPNDDCDVVENDDDDHDDVVAENEDDVVVAEEKEEHTEEEEYTEEEEDDSDDDDDYVVEKEKSEEEEEEQYTEEEVEEEEELGVQKGKKIRKSEAKNSCAGLRKIGRSKNSEGKSSGKVSKERKRAEPVKMNDDDEFDVFRSGRVVPPNNPFFVAKIRRSRRSELYVPRDVIKDHNIKLHKAIILLDPNGRKWSARVCTWKDGRTWLSQGWRRFCKWNNLREEDRCICEFIKARGRSGTFLKVNILRAGSW